MKMEMKQATADLGLLLIGILWGLGFIFVKIGLNEGVSPLYLLSLRFTMAFICLYFVFRKRMRKLNKLDVKAGVLIGLLSSFAFLFQTYGAFWTTAGKNAFFTGINVVIVPYLYWIIHKKTPNKLSFVASIFCVVGIGIMSVDSNFNITEINYGDILTIISAFFYAALVVLIGYYSDKVNMASMIVLPMLVSAIMFNGIILFNGQVDVVALEGTSLVAVLYIAIFSTIIPTVLQPVCQKVTTSTRASILLSTESLFAPIFAYFMLGETLSVQTIIGAGFIFLAVIISELRK